MSRSELREELKKRELPVLGLKEELVERLDNHMQTLSGAQPVGNRSVTEPHTESTPVTGGKLKESSAEAAAAEAEATSVSIAVMEGETMFAAVAGLSALFVSLACIVGGDGLTAVNLASLHVSWHVFLRGGVSAKMIGEYHYSCRVMSKQYLQHYT